MKEVKLVDIDNLVSETKPKDSFIFDEANAVDDIHWLLDAYVEKGVWNLVVFEDSFGIIKHHIPNHGIDDDRLEDIVDCWLEKIEFNERRKDIEAVHGVLDKAYEEKNQPNNNLVQAVNDIAYVANEIVNNSNIEHNLDNEEFKEAVDEWLYERTNNPKN